MVPFRREVVPQIARYLDQFRDFQPIPREKQINVVVRGLIISVVIMFLLTIFDRDCSASDPWIIKVCEDHYISLNCTSVGNQ